MPTSAADFEAVSDDDFDTIPDGFFGRIRWLTRVFELIRGIKPLMAVPALLSFFVTWLFADAFLFAWIHASEKAAKHHLGRNFDGLLRLIILTLAFAAAVWVCRWVYRKLHGAS